jgi:hypothetical protein
MREGLGRTTHLMKESLLMCRWWTERLRSSDHVWWGGELVRVRMVEVLTSNTRASCAVANLAGSAKTPLFVGGREGTYMGDIPVTREYCAMQRLRGTCEYWYPE